MEAQVSTIFDDRDARTKQGKSLVRVRLTNDRVLNLIVGENTRVTMGACEVEVWPHEAQAILGMVEKDLAAIEMAKQSFEVGVVKQALDFVNDPRLKSMADDELLALVREGKDTKLTEAYEKAKKMTGLSVEGEFRRTRGRDIKPLSSAEILAKDIPSPYQMQEVAHAKLTASIMNNQGASKK